MRLWEASGEEGPADLVPFTSTTTNPAFDREGRLFAVSHYLPSSPVEVWELGREKVRKRFQGQADRSLAVALSPDGKMLAVGSKQQVLRWNTDNGEPLPSLPASYVIASLLFSADGGTLVAGCRNVVHLWDLASGAERQLNFPPGTAQVSSLAMTPGGSRLAALSADGRLVWWDLRSLHQKGPPKISGQWKAPGAGAEHALAFAPDGRHLAVGNLNGTVYILRLGSR